MPEKKSVIINEEMVVIIDKLLENKGMTPTQPKKIMKKFQSYIENM